MSRIIFWHDGNIIRECIYKNEECRYKCNSICFNTKSFKKLGKKCHGCEDFEEENNKIEPYNG